MFLSILWTILWAGLALTLWRRYLKSSRSSISTLPLPPGPKPLPLVGNILDVPTTLPWRTYAEWAKTYGDIIHMRSFGQTIIILNSYSTVIDLFEKRSSNYSNRLQTEMPILMGWGWDFAIMEYGQRWRRHRRAFHQFFNQSAVREYEPQVKAASRRFLRHLYSEPRDFANHIRDLFGSSIMSVVYGIQTADKEDSYILRAERAGQGAAEAFTPGTFWIDFLPFLKYIPAWVPGAEFQRKAAKWKVDTLAMRDLPWANTVRDGPYMPIAAKLLERTSCLNDKMRVEEEEIAKNVTAMAYAAGSDTTVSTLQSFFLAMTLYPEVQRRAHEELARIVGPSRLPGFSDRADLLYINALCKECMRWQPVTPLGLAHTSISDDEYNGFLIPGGSVIMQNTWGILHDPKRYPEPEEFRPERYLRDGQVNTDVLDPTLVAFGAGRRICPGRHFSDMSLFINVACILHVFDITPVLDARGDPRTPEPEMTTGFLSHPVPFECDIKPRSKMAISLILAE
ncbi:CyP450 monooxygenase [Obba rivulosa]|uniref:CyP450 monooxygenase n=1 Tax=Obba rivulosa TaxID=1052685 RepID=A0A8E2J355_9APHY|nr:CyP450 monooxygenase [Obba rivulosa]